MVGTAVAGDLKEGGRRMPSGVRWCYSLESVPSPNVLVGESFPIGIISSNDHVCLLGQGIGVRLDFWFLRVLKDSLAVGALVRFA